MPDVKAKTMRLLYVILFAPGDEREEKLIIGILKVNLTAAVPLARA
jgi:hypothetical protein